MSAPTLPAPAPEFFGELPSPWEANLLKAMIYAEPLLGLLAVAAVLLATLILIFKTGARGRYWMLAGIGLLAALGVYYWAAFPSARASLLQTASLRCLTALGFALLALGLLRMAWFFMKLTAAARSKPADEDPGQRAGAC